MADKRKMLLLHNFETGKEIWCDPDEIILMELLAALPADPAFRTEAISARTKVVVRTGKDASETLLVIQHPGQIAGSGSWGIAQPATAGR